MHFEGC